MSDDFFTETPPNDEDNLVVGSALDTADSSEEKPQNTPIVPRQPRRNGSNKWGCACLGLVIALPLTCCSLVLACMGLVIGLGAVAENNEVTRTESDTLEIFDSEEVTLEVSNNVGAVSIRGDDDVRTIEVEMDMSARAISKDRAQEILDNIQVDIRRDGDRYIVAVESQEHFGLMEHSSVNLRITAPEELNLIASSNVGSLSVRDVQIRDELSLENNVGSTEFDGSLGRDGTYTISSNVGEIDVEISADDSFRLNASSNVGAIHVNLDLEDANTSREGTGESVFGIYGSDDDPDGTLTITSNVGAVTIRD